LPANSLGKVAGKREQFRLDKKSPPAYTSSMAQAKLKREKSALQNPPPLVC
jgi:hypothetical protein